MQKLFNTIVSKGAKDNTYKFALTKFLLDYAHVNQQFGSHKISYNEIADKFLEYYWFQECKYKLKQDFKIERMPMIIRIIRKYCGEEYIPESYEKYFKSKQDLKNTMILEIARVCLQDVIPRFQPRDTYGLYQHFHVINSTGKKYKLPPKDRRYILVTEEARNFLQSNYNELSKILIYEWAKFLEKTNFTPMLISKIEGLGIYKRSSLTKYKNILLKQMNVECFYCNQEVKSDDMHIDHFIPWSYVYENSIWNLVISCSECNLKKSDCLAPNKYIKKIEDRNNVYGFNEYNKDVMEYYVNCSKAGFTSLEFIE
jgi:hypothetical protein